MLLMIVEFFMILVGMSLITLCKEENIFRKMHGAIDFE